MTIRSFFAVFGSAALITVPACNGVATARPLSPQAQLVRVEERDPPDDATALGAIEVTDGQGCSFTGDRGTLEGATALLKESAVQRGANFVKITKVTEPYAGHDCYHREFKIEGLSYRLAGGPTVISSAAPPVASAAPAATLAPAAMLAPAPAAACDPICSPGYTCEAGVCRALCNPACSAGQICRVDRVCVPATATP